MEWHQAFDVVKEYLVRVVTPRGHGTGFYLSHTMYEGDCFIATAAHVIQHAHEWEQPIRIEHYASGKSKLLKSPNRFLFEDARNDVAGIIFKNDDFMFPNTPMELAPEDKTLKTGNEIAWLGYPAMQGTTLCFFSGRISAFVSEFNGYLVDGVAINGVSGGPAFALLGNKITLIGVVSAYIANRATGETLPGLSLVRNIAPLRAYAQAFSQPAEGAQRECDTTVLASPEESTPN